MNFVINKIYNLNNKNEYPNNDSEFKTIVQNIDVLKR